jgi:hypothetical protein
MASPTLSANALVTLEEQKRYQSVSTVQTIYDDILIDLINECSDDIIQRVGFAPGQAVEYTETYMGHNTRELTLKHFPVVSVASISINGVAFTAADFAIDLIRGIVRIPWSSPLKFSFGYTSGFPLRYQPGDHNVAVTYTAGLAAVPAQIKALCKQYVKGVFDLRSKDANMTTAQQTGERAHLRDDIYGQLERYRRSIIT